MTKRRGGGKKIKKKQKKKDKKNGSVGALPPGPGRRPEDDELIPHQVLGDPHEDLKQREDLRPRRLSLAANKASLHVSTGELAAHRLLP